MEKQIEGMAKVLNECCNRYDENGRLLGNKCSNCECWCDTNHLCTSYNTKEATALYNAGYRKISEVEKWTIREISEGIENIIAEFERLKAVGFQHDDKWRFDNLVSDIRDFMKEYEEQNDGENISI